MKRLMTILLVTALMLSTVSGMLLTAKADTDDFTFTIGNNGATVTGYRGTATDVTVPATLGGAAVTAIGTSAFENNTTIHSVVLPASVTLIDECAFAGCAALTELTLAPLDTVAFSAFNGCTALAAVLFDGSEKQWDDIDIAPLNAPLENAAITCLKAVKSRSLLPETVDGFRIINEGGGTMNVTAMENGYQFYSPTGYPSAYTVLDPADYTTVDVFTDTYLNFDFTVSGGYTNIILAFNGMDILTLRTEGQYVTINRLYDPSYVDENGIIYDIGDGVYRASVHVGALGCDPSLVTNGKFDISGVKIYSVWGSTVTVRDLSVGEAKYDVWDIAQTSYVIKEKQSLLPASAGGFGTGHTDTGRIGIAKNSGGGFRFSSSAGWPCAFTENYRTGDGVLLADPDDYLYYDFTVQGRAQTHIAVYFAGADPITTVSGTYASLNPLIHPNYVEPNGDVVDFNSGNFKGYIQVRDLGCDPSRMINGKVPISDMKVFAVNKQQDANGATVIRELALVSIETYSTITTTTSSTATTTSTTTTTTTTMQPVTLSLSTEYAQEGDMATVTLSVSDEHYLTNGQIWIAYDPTFLRPQDTWGDADRPYVLEINKSVLGNNCYWAFDIPTEGLAKFAFASGSTTGSAAGGDIFSLTFLVIGDFEGALPITLIVPELCAAKDGVDYDPAYTLEDGSVTLVKRGDVNGNGRIDLADAARLFYYLSGHVELTDKELVAANYYKADSAVNMHDLTYLFNAVNGVE